MADMVSESRLSAWGGGRSPYAISSNKLGMWLFLVSDSLTFSAMLMAYSYVRLATENWPRPFEGPSIFMASVMTFCLLSSSLTMVMAVAAAKQKERRRTVGWISATILGGVLFIILHTNEWLGLIHEGVTPFGNPWGVPLFGASFFTLTGLHMTHVTGGVIYLGVIAFGFGKGKFTSEDVEVSGLYWHFVDLVWMFIFPMVYLLSCTI
ncbi:MAG: cytochrome c oxidase subunit 3 [Acidobacteria bacterium]|nr:cytochrome c oxidase subunit 3 [Acidobacteriota bacterium]